MRVAFVFVALAACASGPPPHTSFAQYPGAPSARDPASDPRAVAIAERVFAAAGGARWDQAREIEWTQKIVGAANDAVNEVLQPYGPPRPRVRLWDRWNGRYAVREHHPRITQLMVIDLYDDHAYRVIDDAKNGPQTVSLSTDLATVRAAWHIQTVLMFLPFLLRDPGVRLDYIGPTFSELGENEHIQLTFPEHDLSRLGSRVIAVVDPAGVIMRVLFEKPGSDEVVAYDLRDRTTVAGLAIPTTQIDLATGQVTHLTNVEIRPEVRGGDFEWPHPIR